MIWQKDRLRPTQPYFVLDSVNFRQEIYLRQGISHFYTFRVDAPQTLNVVPDACIDLFFEYTETGMEAYACGSVLRFQSQEWRGSREVFGVRFMPGMQPAVLRVTLRELLGRRIPLEEVLTDSELLPKMEGETDFYQRIRIFLEHFTRTENLRRSSEEKETLVQAVKRMVYESDGQMRVQEMAQKAGFSERYLNRVLLEEMGMSPKTFSKIIQFQRALEFLNYGAPDKMTDAAVYLGYYDQPQFIRDFKTYCGVTPLQYLKMIREHHYQQQIQETRDMAEEQSR